MRVKVSSKTGSWSESRGAWFHRHTDEVFDVIAVFGGQEPVYEVDVRHLADRGEVSFTEAYVPAAFAEVVSTAAPVVAAPSYAR